MANSFNKDILLQAPDPEIAAAFYIRELGFTVTGRSTDLISLEGPQINLYIERGPALGPVLELLHLGDLGATRRRLEAAGCTIIKDEPEFPRCYVKDPFGLIYNLSR